MIEVLITVPNLVQHSHDNQHLLDVIDEYLKIVSFTGLSFVYYLGMMYLTLDRLFKISLSFTYPQYWSEARTKYLVLATWLLGLVIIIGISCAWYFARFDWEHVFFMYFYPVVEFTFIIIAVLTYALIFRKYCRSTRKLSNISTCGFPLEGAGGAGGGGASNKIKFAAFRSSFFFIPSILILTYLIFMVIPDLTYLFVAIINGRHSDLLALLCWICYALSNILDAVIYIFFLDDVRSFLKKRFKHCRDCCHFCCCFVRTPRVEAKIEMRPVRKLAHYQNHVNVNILKERAAEKWL